MRLLPIVLALMVSGPVVAQAAEPEGTWIVEDIRGGGVMDSLRTTLEIAPDGKVSGHGGCNGFGGSAEIDGNAIRFGPLFSTKMACAPAIMDQEQKFHDALADVTAWQIEETGHLVLLDGNGEALIRLIGE